MKFYLFRKKLYTAKEILKFKIDANLFNELEVIDLKNEKNFYAFYVLLKNENFLKKLGNLSVDVLNLNYGFTKNRFSNIKEIGLNEINLISLYKNLETINNKQLYCKFVKHFTYHLKCNYFFKNFKDFETQILAEFELCHYLENKHKETELQKRLELLLSQQEDLLLKLHNVNTDIEKTKHLIEKLNKSLNL